MISNQPAAAFHYHHHHHGFDEDDDLTVQVSNANSQLGTYLLEGDFDDALSYLDTTEGKRDATARNDPLGLFNDDGVVSNKLKLPKTKNTAIFASLYVRAPLQIIKKICDVSKDADPTDLMYALSVIPHEEEQRLQEIQRKIPYRSRFWTKAEFNAIIKVLIQDCLLHQSNGSGWLLEKCPFWILDASAFVLSPLAMAAYNPDVSSSVLQLLATIEPNAIIDMDCKLFSVSTIPLIIAAASPATSATVSLESNDEVRRNRWEKVTLLMNRDWFYEQEKALPPTSLATIDDILLASPPKLTLHQVKVTCDEAEKRKEWELVRELIKRYNPATAGEESELLSSIQTALAQRDRQVTTRLRKQQEKRVRDEWLHRNMGLVMYPVDIVMDLVYAAIPQRRDTSLVSPMS